MEKKDKQSIIIASVVLVILIGCLVLVIYIKMTHDEGINGGNNVIDEGDNTIIELPLATIIDSFNSSQLVTDYQTLGSSISMTGNTDTFTVNYVKGEQTGVVEGTYSSSILSLKLTDNEEQNNVAKEVFKELVNISCKFNGYADRECDLTVDKFLNENYSIDGLGYQEITVSEKYLRFSTNIKINLYIEPVPYNSGDLIDVTEQNYSINGNDFTMILSGIQYDVTTNNLTINGNVNNVLQDSRVVRIVYTVFDANQTQLMTQEFSNAELENKNEFSFDVSFAFDVNVTYDTIKYISVDFITE